MNLTRVEARNIQGLQYATIEPKPAGATVIGGKNRQGKSSFLNGIAWVLGGKELCPDKPIRTGEDSAECSVSLSADPQRMLPACVAKRVWKRKENGKEESSLSIRTADGFNAPSPQSILDTILGSVGFEPEKFLRAKSDDQVAILRELVGLDFTKLEEEYDTLYAERTAVNKSVKAAESNWQAKTFHADAPEKEDSVADLMEELASCEKSVQANNAVRQAATDLQHMVELAESRLNDYEQAVLNAMRNRDDAKAALVGATIDRDAAVAAVNALCDDPNLDAVRQQIKDADATNQKVRENTERSKLAAYHKELSEEADAKTKRLDEIKAQIAKATTEAKWPIAGLGFDKSGVTFEGRPFEQASTMEQIKICIAIRVALNPSLQFCFIKDGSLLDEEQLALLAAFAEQQGLQLFIERVGTGAECDIVISEGRIVGQEEPVKEEPKPKKTKPGQLALEV